LQTDSLPVLKKELLSRSQSELVHICLGLAKLKTENKQMLAYLLFDADNPMSYAGQVKSKMDEILDQVPRNQYGGTKMLRKALQFVTQYNRFTKFKEGEVELLLHFLSRYLEIVSPETRHPPLLGLAFRSLRKVHSLIFKLHEDLQYDYSQAYNQKVQSVHATFHHWDRYRFPLQSIEIA
jgi:hypothetical protein